MSLTFTFRSGKGKPLSSVCQKRNSLQQLRWHLMASSRTKDFDLHARHNCSKWLQQVLVINGYCYHVVQLIYGVNGPSAVLSEGAMINPFLALAARWAWRARPLDVMVRLWWWKNWLWPAGSRLDHLVDQVHRLRVLPLDVGDSLSLGFIRPPHN
jgi:hypothetical protein